MTTALTDLSTLRARLEAAWARSDEIFACLKPEAMLARPIALRQPFIFYVGHLPAFGWNQVWRGVLGRPAFNAEFDGLFQRGIDPVGVDAWEGSETWPALGEVLAYRDRVRAEVLASFDAVAEREGRDTLADRGRVYQIVIEHELMHHETLLYMLQQLPLTLKARPRALPPYQTGAGAGRASSVTVPPGMVTLGARFDVADFGWDNEFPELRVDVAGFEMDSLPVTNAEWLGFVEAGGYSRRELWGAEAWEWRERVGYSHPAFWVPDGGKWRYRTLFDELSLGDAEAWPVYVSWAEADAYARWQRASLPTEPEFHRAAYGAPEGTRALPWGDGHPAGHGNFGFANWAPVPVGRYPSGASAWGIHELVGNGWEWTGSRFAPFPGFEAYARTYPGYSADFFDQQHYVILGASFGTDEALLRRSFRNWFQPHYPYVFAKFRCVRGA